MISIVIEWGNKIPNNIKGNIAKIAEWNGNRAETLNRWLSDNIVGKWFRSPMYGDNDRQTFSFTSESDAKKFQIRWE